jgi:hypothetical protein
LIPSEHQAQPTLDRFTELSLATFVVKVTDVGKKGKRVERLPKPEDNLIIKLDHGKLGYVREALRRRLDIARGASSEPDGYPARASGADPGGGSGALHRLQSDEEAADASTHLTGPERGADARVGDLRGNDDQTPARRGWTRDQHDAEVERIWEHFVEALNHLTVVEQRLRRMDKRQQVDEATLLTGSDWCQNHLRHGHPREPRNPDGSKDCKWCCWVRSNYGALPNAELIDYRHRFVKLSPRVFRMQFPEAG